MAETFERQQSSETFVLQEWERVVLSHVDEELYETAQAAIELTVQMYSEPHRGYHTLDHIADCLKKLRPYEGREDHLTLFLALLWHDVIYKTHPRQPHEASNEELSAEFAEEMMALLDLPGSAGVYRLIYTTKDHDPHSEDEALMCDIDMSILAAEDEVYDRYAAGIRYEHKQYSDAQYNAGRIGALQSFEQPFHHPDFMHFNEPAFRNMDREVASLLSAS